MILLSMKNYLLPSKQVVMKAKATNYLQGSPVLV